MRRVLIVKDSVQESCDKFIYCTPFYTVSCIDEKIIDKIACSKRILITSRNGVTAFMENISTFDCNFYDKEIIVIGSKTHQLLVGNGFYNITYPYYNIQSLVEKVDLGGALYLSGFHTSFADYQSYGVEREVVYKAIEREIPLWVVNQVMNGSVSNILLYSRRGATVFLKSFPGEYNFDGINFICISQSVAGVVAKYNPKYPDLPLESEMLSLIS